MPSKSLHPQNDRVGEGGPRRDPPLQRPPFTFVARDGETRHKTPLCPELTDAYHCVGDETAAVCYGLNYCPTCRHYRTTVDDSWTDPRYRRADDD